MERRRSNTDGTVVVSPGLQIAAEQTPHTRRMNFIQLLFCLNCSGVLSIYRRAVNVSDMKKNSDRHTLGILLSLICAVGGSCVAYARSQESEAVRIAAYFSKRLPSNISAKQDDRLLLEFSQRFRKRSDLSMDKLSLYVREHPSQLVALRDYLQYLLDLDFVTQEFALDALRVSVRGIVEDVNSPTKRDFAIPSSIQQFRKLPEPIGVEHDEPIQEIVEENVEIPSMSDSPEQHPIANIYIPSDESPTDTAVQDEFKKISQQLNQITEDLGQLVSEFVSDKENLLQTKNELKMIEDETRSVIMSSSVFRDSVSSTVLDDIDEFTNNLRQHQITTTDLLNSTRNLALKIRNLEVQTSDSDFRIDDLKMRLKSILDDQSAHLGKTARGSHTAEDVLTRSLSLSNEIATRKTEFNLLSMDVSVVRQDLSKILDELVEHQQVLASTKVPDASDEMTTAQTIAVEVGQTLSTNDPEQTLKVKSRTKTMGIIQEKTRQKLYKIFDNAKVSMDSGNGSPSFDLTVLKAFDEDGQKNQFSFTQIGMNGYEGRTTMNLGGGYRVLSENELWMLGGNVFYDHEFPDDHQRGSVGVELLSSPFRLNANRYFGISGYKSDRDGSEAKPLGGYDIKADIALPYFPGAFFTLNQFKWKGEDGAAHLKGKDYGLKGHLTDAVSVEVYRRDYDSETIPDSTKAKINFEWKLGRKTTLFYEMAPIPFVVRPINLDRYRLVERENRIVKQKKFSVTASAL